MHKYASFLNVSQGLLSGGRQVDVHALVPELQLRGLFDAARQALQQVLVGRLSGGPVVFVFATLPGSDVHRHDGRRTPLGPGSKWL